MDEFDLAMETICVPVRPGHVLMSNRRSFTSHAAVCHKFHGKASIVTDYETQSYMIQTAYTRNDTCMCKFTILLLVTCFKEQKSYSHRKKLVVTRVCIPML